MIEDFFERLHAVARLRAACTGPHMDAFAGALLEDGYSRTAGRSLLLGAGHLGSWLDEGGVELGGLDEPVVAAFVAHVRTRAVGHGKYRYCRAGGRKFLKWAREKGVVATPTPGSQVCSLIRDFEAWMVAHRNVSPVTLRNYRPPLKRFVGIAGPDPAEFTPRVIRQFILTESQRGRGSASSAVSAVRMLLRQLAVLGHSSAELVAAVPTIAHWKLGSLPAFLSAAEVEAVIAACDPDSVAGRRDRAIILLLARLGLRSGDVLGMRLGDINWSRGEVLVSGKSRRVQRMPLPQDVGDAILAWLAMGRPVTMVSYVFVPLRAPHNRALSNVGVNNVVMRAARRAGLARHRVGPHMLRHSAATSLLRDGMSLHGIGALLRHRSIDTTAIYAKVDTALLASVSRPWPQESVK